MGLNDDLVLVHVTAGTALDASLWPATRIPIWGESPNLVLAAWEQARLRPYPLGRRRLPLDVTHGHIQGHQRSPPEGEERGM